MTAFTLDRRASDTNSTAGDLLSPEGHILCATLERADHDNQSRASRIPDGPYPVTPRKLAHSHLAKFYSQHCGAAHKGMIAIDRVPGRSAILFHMGNWYYQSEGCVLCGETTAPSGKGYQIPPGQRRPGYVRAYAALLAAVQAGGAQIAVIDGDRTATPIA